jgi:hypothetical protein
MIIHKIKLLLLLLLAGIAGAYGAETDRELRRLIKSSSPAVQMQWASKYENARGGAQLDLERAVQLYCAAAVGGHADAQYHLGWMYANGSGVMQDKALATGWLKVAEAGGNRDARAFLALLGEHEEAKQPRCVSPSGIDLHTGKRYAVAPQPPGPAMPSPERREIEQWVNRLAPQYGLDPQFVLAVIQAESNFNPRARSPKNATGLMQLIPETAERFGVMNVLHPIDNMRGGMAYLRELLAMFNGDLRLVLAGYNAGENAVYRYRGIPPYGETRRYIKKILRNYGRSTHPVPTPVATSTGKIPVSLSDDASE